GVDGDEAVVQPEARERLSRSGLALRDFVFVVGKDQILPAAVHVEGGPQVPLRHRRALDVPPGPAGSPGTLPGDALRLARLRRLPEREIQRVPLALARFDASAREEIVQVALGELPVLRIRA